MVLVAVGDEDAADAVPVALQIRHVRDDQVNAQHVLLGEDGAAVHDENIVRIFDDVDVLADLLHAAQGNDLQFSFW